MSAPTVCEAHPDRPAVATLEWGAGGSAGICADCAARRCQCGETVLPEGDARPIDDGFAFHAAEACGLPCACRAKVLAFTREPEYQRERFAGLRPAYSETEYHAAYGCTIAGRFVGAYHPPCHCGATRVPNGEHTVSLPGADPLDDHGRSLHSLTGCCE